MRVILSRKGFDSGFGGVPSPILPDGRLLSLPIPDKGAPTAFGEIHRGDVNVGTLVEDLTRCRIPRTHRAHLDPDLDPTAIARPSGWRPLFGQQGAALSHLLHHGVGPGDLFLFFGWFRQATAVGGHWSYVRGSKPVQALWGWLSIGAIHPCDGLPPAVRAWAAGHPHLHGERRSANSLIIAAETLTVGEHRLPGAGLFPFQESRVLTRPGCSPSVWTLPDWMHPEHELASLSYHGDPMRWSSDGSGRCRLQSVAKGQEFVLATRRDDLLVAWLHALFQGM